MALIKLHTILNSSDISGFSFSNSNKLELISNKTYDSDVVFKKDLKRILGNQVYSKNDGEILERQLPASMLN